MITPAFAVSSPALAGVQAPSVRTAAAITQPVAGEQKGLDSQAISADEWNDLFAAVTARLRKAATEHVHVPAGPFVIERAATLESVVLECVDVMDLLRVLLEQQRAQPAFSPVVLPVQRQRVNSRQECERADHQRM